MDSGIESQPSPVSMLFLASIFILARLLHVSRPYSTIKRRGRENPPVLEPYLHGTLGHVDILGNSLTSGSGRSRVLVKFHF